MVLSQGDGSTPLKAGGTSSHSDQSSNSSGCSQVLQYFSDRSDGLPISATLNPATGIGEGHQVLVSSANPSAASASSLITGGNSFISGNPTLQQSMNMKADSVTSTGAASMGLPTSPLSFSSSNASLARSSGLNNSSLSHSGMTPITRLEAIKDPSVHPMKLLKTETGYQPMPCGGLQYDVNNFGITCQGVSPNVGVRLAHQLKGQGSIGLGQEFHNNEQQLAQLHASMSAAKALRNDYLQQQAAPNRFPRSNSLLSAQLPVPQQQPQHAQAQFLQRHLLQQEQIMRMLPPQMHRSHVLQQQHHLQQLQHQIAGLTKQTENSSLGACSRQLMQYMHHQRMRPADNNIGFWRKFISEYFAPHSRRRWCLSQCSAGGGGCQSNGVFPQDLWRCEICGSSPGRGFEATVEVMPRLCKTKFDNGDLEELLFVDLPYEYRLSSGLMVLEYNKAIQESVYEQLRVVWEGQLRIIFTAELKILSWDFCAKSHEEHFPRRIIVPQVNQLVTIASKYQSAMAQSNGIGLSAQDLQASCNMFVSSARQLTKILEPPCVNELGFTKRFVRCIQIAEVVNSMKDLIDFSRENNLGPIESLSKYPRRRLSAEVPSFLRQSDSMGMEPFVTEQNPTPNPLQSNINDQGNTLSRPESDCTSLLQSQLLRQSSDSLQISAQIDPSFVEIPTAAAGSLVNSLQASPTSSLSSYQTSVSSLTTNSRPAVTAFQNHLAANSRNMNLLQQSCLQHIQSNNQNTNSAVQHFLQGMMSPQSSAGQRNTGNIGMNRNPEEMPSGLVRGMSGINPTNIRVNISGMGGISGGANMGCGSGVNVALRSVGNNLSHMGNMGMHGSRLNLGPLASQQEVHSQDDSLKQGLVLGANSNSEGTINWK